MIEALCQDSEFQAMARGRLTGPYRRALEAFTYGNAACKVDFILSGPVPWTNEHLRSAGTLHVGGTRAEIAGAEADVLGPRRGGGDGEGAGERHL